jgi:hypothetical protein
MKTQIIQDDAEPAIAATHTPPASGSAGAERPRGRILAIWIGGVVAVVGAMIAIGGGGSFAAFGSDGVVSTSRSGLSTPTSALVSETARINDTAGAVDVLGDTSIRISARAAAGRPVFLGVGPARDVQRFLSGVAVDTITDFDVDPFRVQRHRVAGTQTPASPAAQSFWVARGSGRTADVNWKVRDGDYRLVIMNADGARGVSTHAGIGVHVPYLPGLAIGLLIGGLVLAGAGVAVIVLAARRRPRVAS